MVQVLIIEDEAHNSRMLQGLMKQMRPQWQVAALLESVAESVEWLKHHPAPDLILMDIQLSDGICFSIFDQATIAPSTRIIFTTAYDEYALRAFKVNSIDYLLKPLDEKELEIALQKFEQYSRAVHEVEAMNYQALVASILDGKKDYRSRFLISGVTSFQKLETNQIAYIFSDSKQSFAVAFDGKQYPLDYCLEQLESQLSPEQFFRVNRKVIVNIEAVSRLGSEDGGRLQVFLTPKPGFEVMVSRLKATELKNWMGK